ncbi:MAG: hypothetical protein MJ052_03595, partial [Sphaerochaetaceae bacterium]|nr:hypothetical protein [Sphaerochaetaceae bacterium]
MKKFYLYLVLIIALFFTACNQDKAEGLFSAVADSADTAKERIQKVIYVDGDTTTTGSKIYFLSSNGIGYYELLAYTPSTKKRTWSEIKHVPGLESEEEWRYDNAYMPDGNTIYFILDFGSYKDNGAYLLMYKKDASGKWDLADLPDSWESVINKDGRDNFQRLPVTYQGKEYQLVLVKMANTLTPNGYFTTYKYNKSSTGENRHFLDQVFKINSDGSCVDTEIGSTGLFGGKFLTNIITSNPSGTDENSLVYLVRHTDKNETNAAEEYRYYIYDPNNPSKEFSSCIYSFINDDDSPQEIIGIQEATNGNYYVANKSPKLYKCTIDTTNYESVYVKTLESVSYTCIPMQSFSYGSKVYLKSTSYINEYDTVSGKSVSWSTGWASKIHNLDIANFLVKGDCLYTGTLKNGIFAVLLLTFIRSMA